jgi:DNA-binding protein HU-beta
MTKADLVERVSKDAGPTVSKKMVAHILEAVFEHLHKAIRKDKHFTYPGFGTFTVKKRKARTGRNPKTGEVIQIAPTRTVAFKPAPNFKASL